jgi:nitroreductase
VSIAYASNAGVEEGDMEFEDLVRARCMVRAFRPDPVPDDLIDKMLRSAVRAPSAGNLQAWEFVVVREPETKRRLAEAAVRQMFVAEAPVVIVTCRNMERNAEKYGGRGRHFYNLIDASFASLMILLAAHNEGLGACFVGAYLDNEVSRILGLPDHIRPLGVIPIGWPAEAPTVTERMPLAEVVHSERFGQQR